MKRLIPAVLAAVLPLAAHAQQAGDTVATFGWLHIAPQDSSAPLTTHVAHLPVSQALHLPDAFTSAGTGLSVDPADTAGLSLTHFLTDHVALSTLLGVPPTFRIEGQGELRPPGPAGTLASAELGTTIVRRVREWSPSVLLTYYFNAPDDRFRPFVGAGVTYSWFTNIELNDGFVDGLRGNLGAVLATAAGKPGPVSVTGKASSSFSPIFNIGANYALSKRWGLTAGLYFIPLKTYASLVVKAADGTPLATARSRLRANPLISFIGVSYRF